MDIDIHIRIILFRYFLYFIFATFLVLKSIDNNFLHYLEYIQLVCVYFLTVLHRLKVIIDGLYISNGLDIECRL